ncbi:MAG: TAXI family TRAP transporter solute-binding subunit [Armatimonadota bacterium]|nr:TAXI family TRAP transporter solute-binding subunit [Armatimonadota bacterium]MDR7451826.1 TAXI family TRAP transporter solute-binding subunit [Armatimonadota bacterium]MDR7467551.1 TAXI family TRAP transporter solute-binding subunit [Armatimonadota bacterium]MDR7494488.1 TAXI family TRAP transporter solute-binding subunit [Armatimonadota bacterium]MDR7499749.1 TAXI family TRAP transporter solute-binding subunit [Armatimonadota bacterium]
MRSGALRWMLACTVVAMLGVWAAGMAQAQVRVTILGGIVGGGPYLQAAGLGQIMSEHMSTVVQGTVQATPGLGANALRLASGLGDIAVIVSTDGFQVLKRQGPYAEAKKFPLQMYPTVPAQYVHFIVKQSSGITKFADLNGKRINVLTRGSLADQLGTRLLEVLRVRPSRVYHYPHGEAASALQNDEVDAVVAGGIAPAYNEVSLKHPVRVLSFTDEEVALLKERLPQIPVTEADFSSSYRGAGKARVMAPWAVMAARHDLDSTLVYQITKTVYANFATVVKIYKEAESMTLRTVLQTLYPLHPGALRYYREAGLRIPPEMLPPADLPK